MEKNILTLKEKIKGLNFKSKKGKKITVFLSCIVAIITLYLLTAPAITENVDTTYSLKLIDSYDVNVSEEYLWKTEVEGKYNTSYDLRLHFKDLNGKSIEGKNLTVNIGPGNLSYAPYGFGFVPYEDEELTNNVGKDLIQELEIYEYTTSTGEIYQFDHAEVLVDGVWQTFTDKGMRWHIYCNGLDSTTEVLDYGWKGYYGEDNIAYPVNENTEYKLVYKEIRYGKKNLVLPLGPETGITFKLFNYSGDNGQSGDNINNNGVYNYFTFRGVPGPNNITAVTNTYIDADGFKNDTRIKVKPTLDGNGYPVFDCRCYVTVENGEPVYDCENENRCKDFSLGYLFGSDKNPLNEDVNGITRYNPQNTILQKNGNEYYYSSNSNAVDYDILNNKFMLRNYLERAESLTTYKNEAERYEFRPFNYWNDYKTKKTNSTYNREYNYDTSETDNWYGMTMEFNFYMPKNGKIDGEEMVFSFSGDDDVWVFIEDVLVLDLGGTHGAVDGTINFATGKVESYLKWNGSTGTAGNKTATSTNIYEMFKNAGKTADIKWTDNPNEAEKTFADYEEYTLKFFYLERGASVANCKINFNMPVLPSGTLTVKKEYVGSNNNPEELHGFTLYDITSGTKQPVANTKYILNGIDNGNENPQTDSNGYFTLTVNQQALFKLNNYNTYYVEETTPGSKSNPHSCNLNGTACKPIEETEGILQTDPFRITPDSAYIAVFNNEAKKLNLTINKIVEPSNTEDNFEFKVTLKDKFDQPVILNDEGKEYQTDNNGNVTFNLKHGENITIEDIPIDSIATLQETKHDFYQALIKSGDITLSNTDKYENFKMDSNKNITVHNIQGVELPETGGTGIYIYLITGISLMILSIKYLIKLKEGGE